MITSIQKSLVMMLMAFVFSAQPVSSESSNVPTVTSKTTTAGKRRFRAQAAKAVTPVPLKVTIRGPETVEPGTLVTLDATDSEGDSFNWTLAGGSPEWYEVSESGKKVYFANITPGRYPFVFAVSKKNGDGPPILQQVQHVLTVQGTQPNPPSPNPQPQPAPVDPLPEGRFGLARFTRDSVVKNVQQAQRDVKVLRGLADNYATVAVQLESGTISGMTLAVSKLSERNKETVGASRATWLPVTEELGKKLTEMKNVTKVLDVSSNAALATAFKEISLGFSAAAGN